jgi:hypothetical protein
MRKNTMVGLLLAVALGLSLVGCEDTKARQERSPMIFQIPLEPGSG